MSQGAGHLTLAGAGLAGDLLMLAASFLGAVYSVGGKGLSERYPADVVTAVIATLGALFLLPLALIESGGVRGFADALAALPWQVWAGLLLLGLGSGALANLWWLQLLSHTAASPRALILFLIPVVSTTLAVTWLGEPLTPTIVIGAVLVLASVIIVQQHTENARRQAAAIARRLSKHLSKNLRRTFPELGEGNTIWFWIRLIAIPQNSLLSP